MYDDVLEMINDLSKLNNVNDIADIFLKTYRRQYATGIALLFLGIVMLVIGKN
jgi:hypothetical protein